MDDETRDLWQSLDLNITRSIGVIGKGMLVDLEHHEPRPSVDYGFMRGHKSEQALQLSLKISKNAFIHRLAYLAYLISRRYEWNQELVEQAWWKDFIGRCSPTWVDSVWDAVYRQWETRNFVGVVVQPSSSVRWLRAASDFGVPIWVIFPRPGSYSHLDGGFVAKKWEPTNDQVIELQRAQKARLAQVPMVVFSEPQDEPTQLPPADLDPEPAADPGTPTPPTKLPPGTSWHKSWEEFFRNRDITSRNCLEHATEQQKASWESLSQHARKFQQPGKNGARVYVWETCNSGGFYRILQTRFEVARDWDSYFEEALVFSPRHNAWDHCPFSWGPAVEDGPLEDLDDEDDHRIVDSWYAEPEASATVSGGDPEPLEYLYFGYGFLSIEPTTPLGATLPLDRSAAYRIVGLGAHNSQRQPEHLNSFITSIIQEQLPTGHCDLCPTSPPNETFPGKALIHDAVFRSNFPDLADGAVFILENSFNESPLLAVHEPLSILQMVRAGTLLQLRTALQYLVTNGSRFTALYPEARSSSCQQFNLLPNPMRGVGWKPDSEDF